MTSMFDHDTNQTAFDSSLAGFPAAQLMCKMGPNSVSLVTTISQITCPFGKEFVEKAGR